MGRPKKQNVELVINLKGKSVVLTLDEARDLWRAMGCAMSALTSVAMDREETGQILGTQTLSQTELPPDPAREDG